MAKNQGKGQGAGGSRDQAPDVNKLIRQRQQKVDALREGGHNPYRNDFKPTHTSRQVREVFADRRPPAEPSRHPEPLSDERFAVAGRIVEHRSFGKAAFVKVADRHGKLQVFVRRDVVGEDPFAVFKKAEGYDFIGVRGFAFFTKTGELTLMAEDVVLLTKAVRPPPEKWSGLKDKETRYRQRYLDLVANPEVAEVFRKRGRVVSTMRRYFDERDFLEVETPVLHSVMGGAAARPFKTHHNALNMDLKLRIAPELFLKRLLVGGFERVYEMGRNFRNEGLSREHNPEFSMLEFYWAYATYTDLMDLTEDLFCQLAREVSGGLHLSWEGREIDITPPWPRISVADAVLAAVAAQGMEPALSRETLADPEGLKGWLDASGLTKKDDTLGQMLRFADSHGKRVGALFDQLGEAHLPADRPVFVVDYPAAISPLSRAKESDPELVDRFELFIAGREMANGFSELNDPADQRQRFVHQLKDRERGDDEAMEYDEDYCRALEVGMPPAAGEGIGIDRLVMLLCDQPSIRDVILFPHLRPEAG